MGDRIACTTLGHSAPTWFPGSFGHSVVLRGCFLRLAGALGLLTFLSGSLHKPAGLSARS